MAEIYRPVPDRQDPDCREAAHSRDSRIEPISFTTMPRMTASWPALCAIVLLAGTASAVPPGSEAAGEALALCDLATSGTADDRGPLLERGVALARAAVAADSRDARAYLALFCNLGRRVQTEAFLFAHVGDVLRAVEALDTAVALAPDDADIAAAKGALLVRLPRFLGGDPAAGERWLRRALVLDPLQRTARDYLTELGTAP